MNTEIQISLFEDGKEIRIDNLSLYLNKEMKRGKKAANYWQLDGMAESLVI